VARQRGDIHANSWRQLQRWSCHARREHCVHAAGQGHTLPGRAL